MGPNWVGPLALVEMLPNVFGTPPLHRKIFGTKSLSLFSFFSPEPSRGWKLLETLLPEDYCKKDPCNFSNFIFLRGHQSCLATATLQLTQLVTVGFGLPNILKKRQNQDEQGHLVCETGNADTEFLSKNLVLARMFVASAQNTFQKI